jgi:hypothetical protein
MMFESDDPGEPGMGDEMKLRTLIAVICVASAAVAFADERWIGFGHEAPFSEARIEVGRTALDVVEFDLVIPGVTVEPVATDAGDFTRLEVPGLGRIGRVGAPMLPAVRRFVEIPHGATATVRSTVLDSTSVVLAAQDLPPVLYPVQLPMPKCDCPEARAWEFSYAAKAYRSVVDHGQPTLTGPFGFRDHRMLLVTGAAATYDPAAGTLEIATRLRVTVEINGGDDAATAAVKRRLSSRHYDAFLMNHAVNLNLTDAGGWAYPDSAPVEFLIVTPPQFVADLEPFVDWKTSTGYSVSIATTDVIGSSTTDIKSYITGLYNGPNPPVYILMIGDSPTPLATYTPSGGGTGGTDLPFVQMDGDLYPDMMIARWPIDDSTELINMRDKILHYEQPTAGNSAWLNRALFLAGSGYEGTVTTHEEVIAQLMEPPPNSAECDLWYHSNHPTTSQLISDLNTGRAWMVYSAHCGQTGMGGDPPFHSGDVPNLNNPDLYPIANGHCCQSNMWASSPDVFGEVMVIQPDKGFVSYWGGSNSTYWDEDDWLEKGYFDAFFDADIAGNLGDWDRLYSHVAACYAGLSEVTLRGGNESYYWPMYNLNGDPTMDPFTRFPIALTVGAPPVVPPVADDFTVTVSDGAIGPVPLAMVGVTQDGTLLGAGLTDGTGAATFPIDAPSPGSDLLVRVTAHNHLPTDATTMVAAGSDGVVVLDGTIYRCDSTVTINVFDDDLDGQPPFNVTLSASPSGGSAQVLVSSVGSGGVVQFQGTAVLGSDLSVAHGDVLTVTYYDADTGSGSPGVKTDTAMLDCAGPVIGNLEVVEVGATSATVSWTTDEPGDSWAEISPGGMVVSDATLGLDHELTFTGLDQCTEYTISVASTDALGNSAPGGPTAPFRTYTQTVALDDDVESGPGDWTVYTMTDPGTGTNWSIVTDPGTSSPTHAWFTSDEPDPKDDRLLTGPYLLGGGETVLSFWHHFTTESRYDGGVLEVSVDGGAWVDVTAAGGTFIAGGYNDTASGSSPISGRPFWAGSGSLQQVQVDLSALAGSSVMIRFRFVCDGSVSYDGWWVDDIVLETSAPCNVLFADDFELGNCDAWSLAVGELP